MSSKKRGGGRYFRCGDGDAADPAGDGYDDDDGQ
jgi:hypothetical protein